MGSRERRKQVRFANPQIFILQENKDTILYRKSYWEIFARDSARFKLRIQGIKSTLDPILCINHRLTIMMRNGIGPI